jgi:hypothetical protein
MRAKKNFIAFGTLSSECPRNVQIDIDELFNFI